MAKRGLFDGGGELGEAFALVDVLDAGDTGAVGVPESSRACRLHESRVDDRGWRIGLCRFLWIIRGEESRSDSQRRGVP